MTEFIKRFKQNGDYTLRGMRKAAISLLPSDRETLDALHEDLNRGRDVLEDEDLLNMYLYSFGKMHKFKLVKAFVSLLEQVDFHNEEIEIYDWGCGQGLATVCLLDCLDYLEIKPVINRIYLVDRSFAATNRASDIINCILPGCHVETVVNDLNYLTTKDFQVSNIKKIHLLSNILDVESYNLTQFVRLFQHFASDNYYVCVGPYYNRERVDEFFGYIEPDDFFCNLDYNRGEWTNDWSALFRICYKRHKNVSNPYALFPITINKENFGSCEVSLSTKRTAKDSEDKEFSYYWATIGDYICCTGKKFTELLGMEADDAKLAETIKANEGRFEIAQVIDDDGKPIYVNDDLDRPLLKIQMVSIQERCPSEEKLPILVNKENFPNGIDLWVSSPITSKATGEIVYWASIDQFKNGALLYLSHTVYDGLAEINMETVLSKLMTGKFEIVEAKDKTTNELLRTHEGQQIYMIQRIRNVLHADWECTQDPCSESSSDDLPF